MPEIVRRAEKTPTDAGFNIHTRIYGLDLDVVHEQLADRSRVLAVNNHVNPSGKACTLQSVERLVGLEQKENFLIFTDEFLARMFCGVIEQ